MKKVLWGCVIANLVYSLAEFTDIITPSYIIVLLLIIVIHSSGNIKITNRLGIITAITGILLSIFGMGNLAIIASGIAIIMEIINEKFVIYNQKKYNQTMGSSILKEKEIDEPIIATKYDTDIIKNAFDNFISNYDKTNYLISMKYNHTINVAENSLIIAKSIGLDKEGIFLAYIIGILHDIGRFDQIRDNNTLEDNNIFDHANYGCDLLESGLIRQFIYDSKYDKIILRAVRTHDKYDIDDNFTEDEKLYCSIVRDANKLDIFKRLSEGNFKDDYSITKDMTMSSEIINEINKKHTIDVNLVNNELENVICNLSKIYDINYKYTLKTIKQNDYLNKYILLIDTLDFNKISLKKIVNNIYADIDKKL
ncbi:MAG: hypothetical protein K0R72_336 [Clostridia bacterium]|jgi:putative nucleotidyltransferase with HDIG domain|nr:hypothetical protein [Clostridia bacterium]